MIWELIFGFVVLVAASYVGTTMALRGFFGRERYSPSVRSASNRPDGHSNDHEPSNAEETPGEDGPPDADEPPNDESHRPDE